MKRGKKLEHLGINLDYSTPGEVQISMIPYVILNVFHEKIIRTMATPAAEYFFEVKESTAASKLTEEQAILFHHHFAKLPFLSN